MATDHQVFWLWLWRMWTVPTLVWRLGIISRAFLVVLFLGLGILFTWTCWPVIGCRLWWDFPAHLSVSLCPAYFSYLYPPGLSTPFLQLRVTTGLCLGFSSLSFFLETLFKQETQGIADFPHLFMLSQASLSYITCC